MKPPAFQFYPQDWLVGTALFTPAQKGGYIDLLAFEWEHGDIPKEMIGKLSGLSGTDLEVVTKKFRLIDDSVYLNEKLEEVRTRQKKFSENQTNKANKRWKKNLADAEPIPDSCHSGNAFLEDRSMKNEEVNENSFGKSENLLSDDEKLNQYDDWAKMIREGRDPFFETDLYNSKIDPVEVTSERIDLFIGLLNTYPKKRPTSQQAFRKSLLAFIIEQKQKKGNTASKFQPKETDKVYKSQATKKQQEVIQEPTEEQKLAAQKEIEIKIDNDFTAFCENEDCIIKYPVWELDHLVKQGKIIISEDQKKEYEQRAIEKRKKDLNTSYDPVNRVILAQYKAGRIPDSDSAAMRVVAKDMMLRDYFRELKSKEELEDVAEYSNEPAPENIV